MARSLTKRDMVKPTPARIAEPWTWPELTPLGISASKNRIKIQLAGVIPTCVPMSRPNRTPRPTGSASALTTPESMIDTGIQQCEQRKIT